MAENKADVVIIGGGCCGVLTAIHLLREAKKPFKIILIANKASLGEGVAYSTACDKHILNVPSLRMSAYSGDMDHLLRWLQMKSFDANPLGFIQRGLYARYLRDSLQEATREAAKDVTLQILYDEAIDVQSAANLQWLVTTIEGRKIHANNVVLAVGIFMRPHEKPKIFKDSSIAIIGSGLSMADAVLELKANNHQGSITVFARNGALPLPHDLKSYNEKHNITWPMAVAPGDLLHLLRQRLREAEIAGNTWQGVIDSLRPYTQLIWQNWEIPHKKQFLRHLRSLWDMHRHRVAATVLQELQDLQRLGFFKLKQATVINVNNIDAGYLSYQAHGAADAEAEHFDAIIDCAGLITNYAKTNSTLLQSLFKQKFLESGPLYLGVQADKSGKIQDGMYTLGFALHGVLWESIAVPELRAQAEQLAKTLARAY